MELDPLDDLDALLDTIFSSRNPYGGPNLRGLGERPCSASVAFRAEIYVFY